MKISVKKADSKSPLLQAAVFSAIVNSLLLLTGIAGGAIGPRSALSRISNAISAPPAYIAEKLIVQKEHSVGAFAMAAGEFLICSFVFYGFVGWAVLHLVNSSKTREERE